MRFDCITIESNLLTSIGNAETMNPPNHQELINVRIRLD